MAFLISAQSRMDSTHVLTRNVLYFGCCRIENMPSTACKLEGTSKKQRDAASEFSETLGRGVFRFSVAIFEGVLDLPYRTSAWSKFISLPLSSTVSVNLELACCREQGGLNRKGLLSTAWIIQRIGVYLCWLFKLDELALGGKKKNREYRNANSYLMVFT